METSTINDADNRITQITDSNGRIIQYQYDAAGNRTVMITPDNKQAKNRDSALLKK
jgi:YD repeat-containing protein